MAITRPTSVYDSRINSVFKTSTYQCSGKDPGSITMEEKCENLMHVVIETRKQFGKMCASYRQKHVLIENKILNLRLETIANYRIKSKIKPSDINVEDMCKNADDFVAELDEKQKRVQELHKKIKYTQEVVSQLEHDSVGMKLQNLMQIKKDNKE